jgi:PAS domain S-box-containing protein
MWADPSVQFSFDAAPDAMMVVNQVGEIVAANTQAERLFGYRREQLIGTSVASVIPSRLRDWHLHDRKHYFRAPRVRPMGAGLDLLALRADGTEVPVDITLRPFTTRSGTFVVAAIRDATELRRVEALKTSAAVLRETREAEDRFRLMCEFAPVLIWMSGTDRLCTYVNQQWLNFTGRSLSQERGNGWAEGVHPDDLQRCVDTYTHAFDRREEFRMEYRLRGHDGAYRSVYDVGVPRFGADHSFAGYIGSCVDVTERRRAERAEEALSRVGAKLVEAQEEERSRIARELHDDISQRLALLAMQLDRMRQDLPASATDLKQDLWEAREQTSKLGNDIQALSHRLHSSKLQYRGIVAAAQSFCHELAEQHHVEIDFTHADMPPAVPENISLCLFRVLQEALRNAVQHSGVRHFDVALRGDPDGVRLTVRDAGLGFDPEGVMNNRGLGLVSMLERVTLVKGAFSIDSQPERGTTINVRVPLSSGSDVMRAAG